MRAVTVPVTPEYKYRYSICTIVTKLPEYERMVDVFAARGFGPEDCEFLFVDNSAGNRLDAYAGNNRLLSSAQGRYVVLCHQDVLPMYDDRNRLDELLEGLTATDADWAVCGNAGMTAEGQDVVHITDPHGDDRVAGGPFPRKVMSLDENFLVLRAEARLAFSHDLAGFHWYGSDVCIMADILGWGAYVIDFHLKHQSGGTVGREFQVGREALTAKYARAFRARWHYTVTRASIYLGSRFESSLVARGLRKAARNLGFDLG